MRIVLVLCIACTASCALPKVAIGGRVSTATAGGDAGARRTIHSALWIAMSYAPRADRAEPAPPDATEHAAFEREIVPCAIDVACAWEREATYEASWGRAAGAPPLDPESEM